MTGSPRGERPPSGAAGPLRRLARSSASGAFALLLLVFGRNPLRAYVDIFASTLGDSYGFSETLVKVTPLLLTALAVAVPSRIWLINVGGEGQLYVGALCATWAALNLADWPRVATARRHGAARLRRRRRVGRHRRGAARAGVGQRDDLHPAAELRGDPPRALRRLRSVARSRGPQLPADRTRSPTAAILPAWPGSRVHLGLAAGSARRRGVRVRDRAHALGPGDASGRRQRRGGASTRVAHQPLRDRPHDRGRRPRRPGRHGRGLGHPGAPAAEPVARVRLHGISHQLDGGRSSGRASWWRPSCSPSSPPVATSCR